MELSQLVKELNDAVGSTQTFAPRVRLDSGAEAVEQALIHSLTVFPHFVVVERGDLKSESLEYFELDHFISRRPSFGQSNPTNNGLKNFVRRYLLR